MICFLTRRSFKFVFLIQLLSRNQNLNSQINPVVGFDTSLPFAKINKDTEQYIVPRILTRYAPGKMTNATTNDTTLNTDNIFSMNRMNSDELIEKDLSFNLGADWIWQEKKNNNNLLILFQLMSLESIVK